jgi:Uncharacterized protein conserved in bacteria (DUF2252)
MNIHAATRRYETWLGERLILVPADLESKHLQMENDAFRFLRATFYRWMELWRETSAELADAPIVLSVGDLHTENFGTWRDQEGRLVWGVNDFDEAFPLPWTHDLVRLATSAHLAIEESHLALSRGDACGSIMEGYAAALTRGGRPFVLAEEHGWLRKIALGKPRSPDRFWKKFGALPTYEGMVPPGATKALESVLPDANIPRRIAHRLAGMGSLGRQRFVALAEWRGGQLAREAKALAPSACVLDSAGPETMYNRELLESAIRAPDPFLHVVDGWVARRLAPDCARIELAELPVGSDQSRLLYAMGYETGNMHLATQDARKDVLRDLRARPARWLHVASKQMAKRVLIDWKAWKDGA